ncbi:hypothetical protein SCUCBS95973_009302 [Sporothrix curviconia]|uniref:Extracellular membrane protein CFEM domain-containing protein n=1 Tax=Sporothrix curviconia TaxID=1260050 RepID=A0ABP0CTS7_9PEZI
MRVSTQSAVGLLAFFGVASASASSSSSSSSSSLDLAECLNTKAATLAGLAACGHAGSIEYCLANRLPKESSLCSAEVLAQCFVNAGCQPDEALIEAAWTIKRCEAKDGELDELRRRKPVAAAAADNKGPVSTPALAATPVLALRADSTYSSTSTASLVCLTTTTISTTVCPVQSTGANAGKTTLSCFSTTALLPTCAAGLMCDTDNSSGETTCMKKQNDPGAAGIVIAIVFASGIVIAITTMCFFCCRERRQHARMAKAAEAAAIARQAAIDSKRPSAAVRNVTGGVSSGSNPDAQPLMGAQPMPPQHQYLPPQSSSSSMLSHQDTGLGLRGSETSGDLATGPNPFADQQQLR